MSMLPKEAIANEAGDELTPDPHAPVQLPVPASKLTKWNAAMCLFHGIFATITLVVGNLDLRVRPPRPTIAPSPGPSLLGAPNLVLNLNAGAGVR